MATCREITKKYAADYAKSSKSAKGLILDELVAISEWSRANARRAERGPLTGEELFAVACGDGAAALVLIFVAGFLQMPLQLRFSIPAAVTDRPQLLGGGDAVLPLPGMIIHPGTVRVRVAVLLFFFAHNRIIPHHWLI
jgi:hypothetical protein